MAKTEKPAKSRASKAVEILIAMSMMLSITVNAEDYKVYFGNLHAHSSLSDAEEKTDPAEAYRIAKEEGKMDFLCLTEHNHMLTPEDMQILIQAAKQATTKSFVALYGQEYSTLKPCNHSNIFNYPVLIPGVLNVKYKKIFNNIIPDYITYNPNAIIFAEFNHPKSINNDYGFQKDYHGDWSSFVADMDPIVQLIAVANGPADKNIPSASDEKMSHRDIKTDRWFDYLSHGMHLAPVVDHDTHSRTYGFSTAGRTAVWVRGSLTQIKLLQGLASRHCYATEDSNLIINAIIDGKYLPGDIIDTELNQVQLSVKIDDLDEDDALYQVEIYCAGENDVPNIISSLSRDNIRENIPIDYVIPIDHDVSALYVIHVIQKSVDPINNSSVDNAWLAPFWVESSSNDDDTEKTP